MQISLFRAHRYIHDGDGEIYEADDDVCDSYSPCPGTNNLTAHRKYVIRA